MATQNYCTFSTVGLRGMKESFKYIVLTNTSRNKVTFQFKMFVCLLQQNHYKTFTVDFDNTVMFIEPYWEFVNSTKSKRNLR